jgi:uncharacterized membrane protein
MNPSQKKVAGGLGCLAALGFGWLVLLLILELFGVAQGADASISRLIWGVVATQGWIVWLVSVLMSFVAGFFGGHFVSQSQRVYDEIREGKR